MDGVRQKDVPKGGCKKCGYIGHLTFECRNFQRLDPAKEVTLDVSSTSSESDSDTPLQALRKYELEKKIKERKKEKKRKKKKKRKERSRSPLSDSEKDSCEEER